MGEERIYGPSTQQNNIHRKGEVSTPAAPRVDPGHVLLSDQSQPHGTVSTGDVWEHLVLCRQKADQRSGEGAGLFLLELS